jgi:hypothetical protein
MVSHACDRDDVERAVRRAITAPAEPVPARRLAAAGRLRSDAAQLREGGFVADPLWVIANSHEELSGGLDPDAEQGDELRRRLLYERLDLTVEVLHLFVEGQPSTSELPQRSLRRSQKEPLWTIAELEEFVSLRPEAGTAVHERPLRQLDELIAQRRWRPDHDPVK